MHCATPVIVFGSAHISSEPVTRALRTEWLEVNELFGVVFQESHAAEQCDRGRLEIAGAQLDCYHGGIPDFCHA